MGKVKKGILCGMVFIIAVGMLFALSVKTGIKNKSEDVRPPLFDTPSYVEVSEKEPLTVKVTADTDAHLGSLSAVIVNTDSNGKGSIGFKLVKDDGELIFETEVPEAAVTVGEWFELGTPEIMISSGENYELTIEAKGCNPYFIKTQIDATNRILPFTETVVKKDAELGNGISIGTSIVSDDYLTYGEIFYYSKLIIVLLAAALIMFILLGKEGTVSLLNKIPLENAVKNFGSDIFLVILFITICFSIYINGYLEGINISADSAGYLREAVNMASGHGFHYDGLAGYSNTWFANWPILYPLMIAAVMKITGMEVYAASKLLSMLLVGVLIAVIRFVYKKDAWFYGLFMTNLGLMYLYWYSWSELPFILFMVLFCLALTRVISDEKMYIRSYVFLGLTMILCFLTRYFGIFTFGVMGLYILVLMFKNFRDNNHKLFNWKVVAMTVTSAISGVICLLYLINNKIQNGMPSGVSRSMWWDDYQSLTNDLVKALLCEIFNIFHMDVPSYINTISYGKSVLIVMLVILMGAVFIRKNCRRFTRASVFITTGIVYYAMFTVIRYFSSMDTFYYRFFAPATFLITLGLAELLIKYVKDGRIYNYLLVGAAVYLAIFAYGDLTEHIMKKSIPYYDIVQMSWDEDYSEIPDHSVVIFSTLDYRSLYYRADVVEGTIEPSDTMDTLRERYNNSSYMCILTSDAMAMRDAGIYDSSINEAIDNAVSEGNKYCVIGL